MNAERLQKHLSKTLKIRKSTGGILATEGIASTSPYDWAASEGTNDDGSRIVLLPMRIPAKIVKCAEVYSRLANENIDTILRDLVAVIGDAGILTLAMERILEEQPNDAADKH